MSTLYKYYLNGYEYAPINTGGFTFDYNLMTDAGAYHFEKSINGTINFKGPAYDYILQHGDCQKIELTIKESCTDGEFIIFDLFFTHHNCKFSPDQKIIEITPKQNTLYQCLIDNYDREFNFLQVPSIVSSQLAEDMGQFETLIVAGPCKEIPFYADCLGSSFLNAFSFYARELRTVYCKGGELQPPTGTGWQLLYDNCAAKNLSTWYRTPPQFLPPAPPNPVIETVCSPSPCVPLPPPATTQNYVHFGQLVCQAAGGICTQFWIDTNGFTYTTLDFDNGRPLIDVLNFGVNVGCAELDIQSNFLNNIINPVTGTNPSTTKDIQLHAISDIKDPNATEQATNELITLKTILNDYISSKLNCFWRIDEGTQRLIIEHYKDLTNTGIIDLTDAKNTKYTALKNKYSYDNTDIPKAESFPSR